MSNRFGTCFCLSSGFRTHFVRVEYVWHINISSVLEVFLTRLRYPFSLRLLFSIDTVNNTLTLLGIT